MLADLTFKDSNKNRWHLFFRERDEVITVLDSGKVVVRAGVACDVAVRVKVSDTRPKYADRFVSKGSSAKHPKDKNITFYTGARFALAEALLPFPKQTRADIWAGFLKHFYSNIQA
jgi:hypothetical protein